MDTKMLMRIYARAGGYSTDNPPCSRTPHKQAEKLNPYAVVRERAARKSASLHHPGKPPVRY